MTSEPIQPESLPARVGHNFITHSGHVPLVVLILEILLSHPGYFAGPDPYVLLGSGLFQAWLMESGRLRGMGRTVLANLAGPLSYSLIEAGLEGAAFFSHWHHQAYWLFAGGFALLHWRQARSNAVNAPLVLAENILRAAIPLAMYAVFEVQASGGQKSLAAFFDDSAHDFLALSLLMLGALLGLADIGLRRSMLTIHALNGRLRQFSEWSLGRGILARAISDESALALQRVCRAVLFLDIRRFTAWSEQQPPERVVGMLNEYYLSVEQALAEWEPIKLKFTADEVMAVFPDASSAVEAGRAMLSAALTRLTPHGLSAGAGIHLGPVVEGVLGGRDARVYDFIGDTVNTAQRLCEAAAGGELLISIDAAQAARLAPGESRAVTAKGKADPITAIVLHGLVN